MARKTRKTPIKDDEHTRTGATEAFQNTLISAPPKPNLPAGSTDLDPEGLPLSLNTTYPDRHTRTIVKVAAALCGLIILANIVNSTLMYDDAYLVKHFRLSLDHVGLGRTMWVIFFNLDLPNEYRLYGLSRLFHFFLWLMFGSHAWAYSGLIGAAQALSAWGIYRVLRRFNADEIQSAAAAIAWGFSFFLNTTCFHHYSYLILPYQLTIGCALILHKQHEKPAQWFWRVLAAAVCMAIAWTGEAHLLASMVILLVVAIATPSDRAVRERRIDAAVLLVAILAAAGLHRFVWSMAVRNSATHARYAFSIPTAQQFFDRTATFLNSLYKGAFVQIQAVVAFASPWFLITGVVLTAAALWFLWYRPSEWLKNLSFPGERRNSGIFLSARLLPVLLASLTVVGAVSIFSGQVSPVLPRRYGYVPYSLMAVAVLAFLTDPWMRRKAGLVPAVVACVALVLPWLVLHVACLPVVRAQDGRVWAAARTAMAGKSDPCVLFITAWNHPDVPGFQLGAGTPGLRGSEFPEVFESPLMGYWWESQYARMVLGARYVGYRAVPEGPGRVRLLGNGLLMEESTVIPTSSLVVLADLGLHPPRWDSGTGHLVAFSTWDSFQASVAAHPVTIESGWNGLLDLDVPEQSIINLGQPSSNGVGLLPDKRFSDPAHPDPLVANYGFETGSDEIFPAPSQPHSQPLPYFFSNRHGNFTYRLDFTDPRPKWVIVDLLDLWHQNAGERLMKIEAALDGQWFLVGTIDPAAESGRLPLHIKFPAAGVASFRIRVTGGPDTDIPFLNGIRVVTMTTVLPPRARSDVNFGPPSINIDTPKSGSIVSGMVMISGWALDNASGVGTPINRIQILVDGVPVGNATYGASRPDVCAGYPDRPGCPNVGFTYQLNTASLKQGPHKIAVSVTDSDPTPHTESAVLAVTVR